MTYLARVELHTANWANYDTLHAAMAKRGFQRTIRGDDGVVYQLPTAEYLIDTTATGEQVRAAAVAAADSTGKAHEVFVVHYEAAWWTGLAKVRIA